MTAYIFDGKINKETVQQLFDFLNANQTENIMMSICCTGGEYALAKMMIQVLNEQPERIILVSDCMLYSSGFDVFYHFKGKKILTVGVLGMTHNPSGNLTISANGEPYYEEDKAHKRSLKSIVEWESKWLSDILTKKECKDYALNKPIYFDFKRMTQIFPNAEII